jgi:hypothetical protein
MFDTTVLVLYCRHSLPTQSTDRTPDMYDHKIMASIHNGGRLIWSRHNYFTELACKMFHIGYMDVELWQYREAKKTFLTEAYGSTTSYHELFI